MLFVLWSQSVNIWWKLGLLLILWKFVIAGWHIYKNFITVIRKHHAKWRKTFGKTKKGKFGSTDGLVIKHSVKTKYAYKYVVAVNPFNLNLMMKDLDAHLCSSRNNFILTLSSQLRLSIEVFIIVFSYYCLFYHHCRFLYLL